MRLVVRGEGKVAPSAVERLARRMVHPLCGLDSRVGFLLRGRPEPRFAIAGGQLSGVHRLLGQQEAGSYHIGGVGLTRHEALVRTLGESAERYCQLVSVACGSVPVRVATVEQLGERGHQVIDPSSMGFFSDWFGPAVGPRIVIGRRLAALGRLVESWMGRSATPSFHHLASPDLPPHSVVCLVRQPGGRRPVAAVGLGSETRLVEACYKAMPEAVGVFQLAKTGMAAAALDGERAGVREDETAFFDLDSNVVHYGDGGGADVLAAKFPTDRTIADDDLPDDLEGAAADVVAELWRRISERGARLYELDLTTPDVADLGLVTIRLWSPDLLALALPSAPPVAHRRFVAHGGAVSLRPHPYP